MVRILRENWLFLLVIGGIVGAFLFLRTPASAVSSVAEVDAILQDDDHLGARSFREFRGADLDHPA